MKSKRESGEVVVEASIIVTLAVMVITVMLYVGMIIYQKTLVSVIANQTASNIAQVYSNNMKDPFTGYVEPDRVYQSVTYGNMKTDAYLSFVRDKASVLGDYRMESSAILKNDYATVDVEIVKKPNELLKSQIVITIQDRFNLPLAFLLGGSSAFNFTATGRADCVDILEYVNGVEAVGDPSDSNIIYLPDAKNCTVTFIPDSDNPGDLKTQTVLKGHSIMSSNKYTHCVMPAEPKKGELEFAGWYTDDGRAFTSVTQVDNNTTVYGRWMCTVTMNANGGTVNGKTTDTKKVAYGNRTALPTPVRDGYVFENWVDEKGNLFVRNDTVVIKNCTVSAQWRCLHKRENGVSKISLKERKQFQCREVGGAQKSYEIYKCSGCDYEYKVAIENKHYIDSDFLIETDELIVQGTKDDFTAQCNRNHLSGATTGTSGSYDKGFETTIIRYSYHITCGYCGMHLPKVYWKNIDGSNRYDYIYWTSYNSSRKVTQCRDVG